MKRLIYIIYFLSSTLFISSQNTDSLLNIIYKLPDDSLKALNISQTAVGYMQTGENKKAEAAYKKVIAISEKINYKEGIATGKINLAAIQMKQGNYDQAEKDYLNCLKYCRDNQLKFQVAQCNNLLGSLAFEKGDINKALQYFIESSIVFEDLKDKAKLGGSYNNIGAMYSELKNDNAAYQYYFKALKIFIEINNKDNIIACWQNIGIIHQDKHLLDSAEYYYLKALKLCIETNNIHNLAISYNYLGSLMCAKKNYDASIDYYNKGLKLAREMQDMNWEARMLLELTDTYLEKKDGSKILEIVQKVVELNKSLQSKSISRDCYKQLWEGNRLLGRNAEADAAVEKYIELHDSLLSEENIHIMNDMKVKYETDKQDKEIAIKNVELKAKHAEVEKASFQRNAFIAGFALVIVLLFFVFRSYRQKQQANIAINTKNEIITQQKHILEEKQKEIVDSINYAKRIQYTLLANDEILQQNLKEHFVYFKPKDIVSGDFYWTAKKGDRFYLAVCDSTGHGVPGAFMSLLNISFLNEAVNEKNILKPNEILDHVRHQLINTISKDGGQDGMDAVLMCMEEGSITYAAANNSPLLIQNGQCSYLEADKMPVGKGEKNDPFTLRTINLQKGDSLYLYTDGYADQFGGTKGKKFKYKQLNELLLSVNEKNVQIQKEVLDITFANWKGNLEQVDDVCVIGIKI